MVDLIFVKYHQPGLMTTALRSLQDNTNKEDVGSVIIVCNDHEFSDFQIAPPLYPFELLLVDSHQNSYAHGCNVGFKHSKSPLVCFCNTDLEFQPNWLEPIIQCFENYPAAIVAPKLLLPNGTLAGFGCTTSFTRPDGWKLPNGPEFQHTTAVLSVGGACFVCLRSFLEISVGLDENYPFYYEETDLCLQAHQLGYRVLVCGQSTVIHKHRGSSQGHESRLSEAFDVSQRYFEKKWSDYLKDFEVTL